MFTVQALHLGPIMLPWGLIIPTVALLLSLLIGKLFLGFFKISTKQWSDFKDSLWTAILIALIAARIGFIFLNFDSYLDHSIEMIKIQDKGFHLYSGIIAALIYLFWKNRTLPKKFIFAVLINFGLFCGTAFWGLQQIQFKYQQYPQLTLQTLQHKPIELSQFTGKPTVINLWASWCPPCRREMPVLLQAQHTYPDVQFVLINQGEDAETIKKYIHEHAKGLNHVLLDPQGLTAEKTGMYGLPSTLFFNAQGKLISSHMGELTHATLNQKIKQIQMN